MVLENIPSNNTLVEGSPIHFRFYYSAAQPFMPDWANECVPTSYTIYLAAAPDFTITDTYSISPTTAENLVNLLMYHFYLSGPLQPHTSYRWLVVGHADGIDISMDKIPYFQEHAAWEPYSSQTLIGAYNYSLHGGFQTGPGCDAQTIGAANLLSPPDAAALDIDTHFFQWDMPDCSAKAYRISFSTDPQMNSIYKGWVTGHESHLINSGDLQPCTIYYWNVQAGLYSATYHMQAGNWSTASEIRSFIIRDATCPNALGVPTLPPPLLPSATHTATVIIPTATKAPTAAPTQVNCGDYETKDACEAHGEFCFWYRINDADPGSCYSK
jgi:hypothetical protein